jgi:alpha-L-rhamnosidase
MLHAIWAFWKYYLFTGDAGAIGFSYPVLQQYLGKWTFDKDGLVVHRAGDMDWLDWGTNIDVRLLDSVWFCMALESMTNIARMLGLEEEALNWQLKKSELSKNINRLLWNSSRNEYRSPGYLGDTDDRGNALAVVAGLVDPARFAPIAKVLSEHRNASPYFENYVIEALYLMGEATQAEKRLADRYSAEVADSGYTLWELWTKEPNGTENHGWNSAPFNLSEYAAGVGPTQPGFSSYQVVPQLGNFTRIAAVIPTVKGTISVVHQRFPLSLHMNVSSPPGTSARLGVPRLGTTGAMIKANGVLIYRNGASAGEVAGLSFAGEDSKYVYFNAVPGLWEIESSAATELVFLPLIVR